MENKIALRPSYWASVSGGEGQPIYVEFNSA